MIRPYTPADYEAYVSWSIGHGAALDTPEYLPPTGLVADEIAMAWLVKTDMACALIVNLVTDPLASMFARGRAARAVIDGLKSIAKENCYSGVCFFTRKSSVIKVGESYGAKNLDFDVFHGGI